MGYGAGWMPASAGGCAAGSTIGPVARPARPSSASRASLLLALRGVSPKGVLFRDSATPGFVEVWPLRFSALWGESRRRRGGGLCLYPPSGLVAPSVSLPMVGCHLRQGGRKRAVHSPVSHLSATEHLRGRWMPSGARRRGSKRCRDRGLTPPPLPTVGTSPLRREQRPGHSGESRNRRTIAKHDTKGGGNGS
jgi:hypothetical protein